MLKKQMIMALFVVGMVGSVQGAAAQRSKMVKELEKTARMMVSEEQVTELIRLERKNGINMAPEKARSILEMGAMVQIRLELIAQGAGSLLD
jgi:hypothetical protein